MEWGVVSKIDEAMGILSRGWCDYPNNDKGGQIQYGCGDGVSKEAPYYHTLVRDLASSYYWSGHIGTDYWFFVTNWHPILGMLLCHPNHPWTKWERVLMFVISVAFTLLPSAAITAAFEGPQHRAWESYGRIPVIFAFVTVPDLAVSTTLYQLSIADSRCPNCWGRNLDRIRQCIRFCMALFAAMSAGMSYLILNALHREIPWGHLFLTLFQGKLWSSLTWFPIMLLLPCKQGFLSLWRSEKHRVEKQQMQSTEGIEMQALLE